MYAASPILRSALQLLEKAPFSSDLRSPFERVTSLESALPQNRAQRSVTHLESTRFLRKMLFSAKSVSATPAFTTLADIASCKPTRMNTSAKRPQALLADIRLTYFKSMFYIEHEYNWSDHFSPTPQSPPRIHVDFPSSNSCNELLTLCPRNFQSASDPSRNHTAACRAARRQF